YDTETGGLNANEHSLFEVAAILDDTNNQLPFEEVPKFQVYIGGGNLCISEFALKMHIESGFWDKYLNSPKTNIEVAFAQFQVWLHEQKLISREDKRKINVLGKNPTFDVKFSSQSEIFKTKILPFFSHRLVDPSALYTDFNNDEGLPNSSLLKE